MPDDTPSTRPRPRATRILIEYSDGTAEEATGADADAILRGYHDAIAVATMHGCPYRGPQMRRAGGGADGPEGGRRPPPALDWPRAYAHFDGVRHRYLGLPAAVGGLALIVTFSPLAARYASGERTRDLHDAMLAVE